MQQAKTTPVRSHENEGNVMWQPDGRFFLGLFMPCLMFILISSSSVMSPYVMVMGHCWRIIMRLCRSKNRKFALAARFCVLVIGHWKTHLHVLFHVFCMPRCSVLIVIKVSYGVSVNMFMKVLSSFPLL